MPDASGRFKGISVPELPWLKKNAAEPLKDGSPNRDTRPKLK